MIKSFRNFALMALAALGMGTMVVPQAALAQTAPTTTTTTNPTTTTPPATTCGATPCVPAGTTIWSINAGGAFGGAGAGVFSGTNTGMVEVTKQGGVNLDLKMNGQGCASLDCSQGASSFTFAGRSFENVGVNVTASGGATGVPVMVENQGAAAVGMTLNIQRLQGATVAPHSAN